MPNSSNRPPRPGSTDWAARQVLHLLEREERDKKLSRRFAGRNRQSATREGPSAFAVQRDPDPLATRYAHLSTGARLAPSASAQIAQSTNTGSVTSENLSFDQRSHEDIAAPNRSLDPATRMDRLKLMARDEGMRRAYPDLGELMAATLEVPASTIRRQQPQVDQMIDTLLRDPMLLRAEADWVELTGAEREAALRRAVELHSGIFGYGRPRIAIGDAAGASGRYDQATNTITFDPASPNFRSNGREMISTAIEEATHAHQWKLTRDFADERIPADDPMYPLAEILYLNNSLYTSGGKDAGRYRSQPIEAHAKAIADRANQALLDAWRRQSGQ